MPISQKDRIVGLDSIRGIAALAVVIHHASALLTIQGLDGWWEIDIQNLPPSLWPERLFDTVMSPFAAVIFFFVLSGYVLTRTLMVDDWIAGFYVKRLMRLAPPFVASILFCWVVSAFTFSSIVPAAGVGQFASQLWPQQVDVAQVVSNLGLWSSAANPVSWTILAEAWGSVFLPLFIVATIRFRRWWPAPIALVIAISGLRPDVGQLAFFYCFAAGALIALKPPRFLTPGPALAVSLLILLVLGLWHTKVSWLNNWVLTIAAVLAVHSVAVSAPAVLSARPLQFLGRISYSLYLLQLPIVYLAFRLDRLVGPSGQLGVLFVVFAALALLVPLATLSYEVIERPSIRLGRMLSDCLRPKAARRGSTPVPQEAFAAEPVTRAREPSPQKA